MDSTCLQEAKIGKSALTIRFALVLYEINEFTQPKQDEKEKNEAEINRLAFCDLSASGNWEP